MEIVSFHLNVIELWIRGDGYEPLSIAPDERSPSVRKIGNVELRMVFVELSGELSELVIREVREACAAPVVEQPFWKRPMDSSENYRESFHGLVGYEMLGTERVAEDFRRPSVFRKPEDVVLAEDFGLLPFEPFLLFRPGDEAFHDAF